MNVIFDCERMKHPYTGLFEYCAGLGKALLKTKNGNHLSYYLPEEYRNYFGNSDIYNYSPIHKFFPLRLKNIDILHSGTHSVFVKSKNMKRVITIHDLNFLYEKKSAAKHNKYLNLFQKNIDNADAVVTISEFSKSEIFRHLDLKGKPISVIYNGCNVAEFTDFDAPSYRPCKPFLFSLGTVLPKKNFHVLPCLLQNNDYELIISGVINRDYAEKIITEAKLHGVSNRVKLTGAITAEDKYWYLKNCSAFLFPSLAEGFGIPPIEAMHFGKAVFLSTSTSLPEIGGKQAYYFADFDPESMQKAFEDGMNDYTQNNRRRSIIAHADSFNWEKSAQKYWKVYESLLSKK
jgi:glycosyltransferase involved in cell wall biosynthesis